MSRHRSSDRKVYVGDLGKNVDSASSRQELEDSFSYYGHIRDVWVARNPPGFAFIEYEDARDAEDAVRGLDGRTVCGRRVRVEMSNGKGRRGGVGGAGLARGRGPGSDDRCYECGECGHFARNCTRRGGRGRRRSNSPRRRSRSNSRSRSRNRSRSRSRSKSRSRNRSRSNARSKSKDRSRSRSRSDDKRSKSRSRSRSRAKDSALRNGGIKKDRRSASPKRDKRSNSPKRDKRSASPKKE